MRVSRPLRILAVTLRYPPYVAGGYELLTRDVVEGLRTRGHRVDVLCGKGRDFAGTSGLSPRLEPDLDTDRASFQHSFDASNLERFRLHFLRLSNWSATREALHALDADLCLCFNLGLVSLAPLLAARHCDVPTLVYASDPWPENHWLRAWRDEAPADARDKALRLAALERGWSIFRDLVGLGPMLVPSRYLGDRLVARGVRRGDLDVVPLGLSPELERSAAAAARPARAEGEPLRVLCTSMHWEGKGVHVLLEAARDAVRRGVDLRLCLAGSGDADYARQLDALAEAPELAGRVERPGLLSRDELSRAMSESHVFVLPSLWGEPFALSVLEAMAHGLAPIATSAGGSPEQITDGDNGLLVPPGDAGALASALVRLGEDEALRAEFGRASRARAAEEFGHERFVDGCERAAALASARVGELR